MLFYVANCMLFCMQLHVIWRVKLFVVDNKTGVENKFPNVKNIPQILNIFRILIK